MPRNVISTFNLDACSNCRSGCPLNPQNLQSDHQEAIAALVRHRSAATKGEEIYYQGEVSQSFYIVSSGWVCLYVLLEDGRRQNVGFALPGDIIGYTADPKDELDHAAEAVCNVTLCTVDRATASPVLVNQPDLMHRINDYLVWKNMQTRQLITSVARKTAIERVAYLFYELFLRLNMRQPEAGDTMAVPLTQGDIGDAVGLSSVHVCRMLSAMKSEGILALRHGKLTIYDADRLADLANLNAESFLSSCPLIRHLHTDEARLAG